MKSKTYKFLILLTALIFGFGQMWAADPVENVGTYSTQVISADGTTSTWTFITPGSQVTVPAEGAYDNDILYAPAASSKMKFSSSNGFSWSGQSTGCIHVPSGSAGTISMTVKSSSDSRYLQLYVGSVNAGESKRLWSKYNATPTSDGKKGPQSFSFTADDITTVGGQTYLRFVDNNTEMKIASFTVTLTTGNYLSSGPVDPTASFSDGDYTIGGSDLDLSSLFTTNSDGAVTYTITNQGTTDAALRADGKSFYATTAGTATVKVEQAATSSYNAYDATASITVAACETSISGQPSNASLKVGDANPTLSVTAANVAAYAWKESSDGTSYDGASTLGSGATYTPSVNDAVQTKYYYCEVTSSCSGSAVVKSNIVTVEVEAADPPCAELVPATSGDAPAAGGAISLSTATGGSMKALTTNLTYTANGLQFGSSSSTKAEVTLTHLMQVGTVITATIYNADDSKARGLKLLNSAGTSKATWTKQATGDHVETYTVVAGDGLAGSNVFQLQRSENACLKSITVSNCGAELHALTSAIDPIAAEGKATITLSKSLVAEGATATATYSAIDAAYDFDEWVISGATIDNAKANPVTITMGSTDAVITLKLKAASVKYTVHFDSKGGSAVADQLVDAGEHASVPTAPTKFKYTFGGWSETDGGSTPADLGTIEINAEKTFYAIWTDKVCPTSGTVFSLGMNGTKPSSEIKWTNATDGGVRDVSDYCDIVNGLAVLVNNSSSNNQVSITTTPNLKISNDANGWLKLSLECVLAEGDIITLDNNSKCIVSYTADKSEGTTYTLPNSSSHTVTVPAAWAGQDELYFFRNGGGLNISSITITRPAKYEVTFNMHDHGTAPTAQSVVEGGKVAEPDPAPTASGWDFGGWYTDDTYGTAWDFTTMTISAATEIHALWTAHTTSSDATLKDLTVGGVTVDGFDPATEEYNVVLEMGTTTAPSVAGTANDDNAKSVTPAQASTLPGDATVTVLAEDNSTSKTYTVHFTVASSKDINLVFKTGTDACKGTPTMSAQILSNNAAVSTYINQITFTNVEGAGDDGAEGSSLNVGKKAGNMFTLSAKAGYAFAQMHFLAKIQDANCEYSINGGAWTTLTSTNTGGDECYAPFTSGTVHEFRLRSTGANGVWIRNMQLNIVEACTPVAITWDEEPVEFEVGKAGYAIAATANNGGTIAYGSSDASIISVDAGNGELSVSALGSATLSASTAEGDGTTYCDNSGADIVINKVVNTYYLVKFDGQNGEAADEVKYYSGDAAIALPAAPSYPGFDFQGWFDAETGGNQYTAAITPAASMTVYAQWVAQCAGATITTQPTGTSYLTGRTATALVCEATAGAGGALTYEWFTCDDELKTNPVAATATPSTVVAGTFYYFCKVTEAGCAVEAFSNVVTITVTDKDPICLAWVDVTGQNAASLDASKSLYAPAVSAAGIKNSSTYSEKTGWKFNSAPGYIAIEGAPFKSGDIVEMFVTTVTADKARVFNANEAIDANIVAEGAANMVQGANKVALTADANNLYLRRGDDYDGWNPYVAYIAVYRVCAPILNKVTIAGVDGTPDNTNHVAIEVPASTDDAALSAITYDWVSNNAAWTDAHDPAVANAWEFGVENTVTLTDKDGDESVYYITISKAAASSDATLSALTVNGQAIALADGVFEYSFELPYGTTVAPTVEATPNHVAAVATVDPCTVSGATITVVPESGAGDQKVYTLTFTISAWKEIVVWDGSMMTEVATSPDATTGFAWSVNGFSSITNYNATCGTKAYTKTLPSGGGASASRNVAFTVPAGYVAKFYIAFGTHSDGNNRGMFIGSNATKTLDATSVLTLYSDSRTNLTDGTSEIVGAGTYYLNPMESEDFYEIRAYLRPGYARTDMLGNGVLGTICLPNNVPAGNATGATFYALDGKDANNKMVFEEVTDMAAGVPYVFESHGDRIVLFYGDTHVDDPENDASKALKGTFEGVTFAVGDADNIYFFRDHALWSAKETGVQILANRAWMDLSVNIPAHAPKPGRRYIYMGVNGQNVVTGMDEITNEQSQMTNKVIIDGHMYIIRGEKMYDGTGRLVK